MKYRITGNYRLNFCRGDELRHISGGYLDHLVDAPTEAAALIEALSNALANCREIRGSTCEPNAEWAGMPEIKELPADQEMNSLPPDIAPRLFD